MTDEVELPKTVPTRTAVVGGGGELTISADGISTISGSVLVDGKPFASGGWISAGPVTSGTIRTGSIGGKWPKMLPAPARSPKKILIAFLGDDDEVEWCAKVYPGDVNIHHDIREPTEMSLSFRLIDADESE